MADHSVGAMRVRHLSAGTLALDGGAMFGVVPKTLWDRVYPADAKNRIRLGMNLLLVGGQFGNLLVDTGAAAVESPKMREIYDLRDQDPLEGTGLAAGDIDHVVLTHLHFDHAGGATVRDGKGFVPRYENATYWLDALEWRHGADPNERERASYLPHTYLPLMDAGVLNLVEEEAQILPGITLVPAPGHTAGHRVVRLADGDEEAWYLADLVPTTRHLPLPWIMAYDLEPLVTLATRKALYPRFVDTPSRLYFEHDEAPVSGWAVTSGRQVSFSPRARG